MRVEQLNPRGHVLNDFQKSSLEHLASVITELEDFYGEPFLVTSGFRTKEEQMRINPAVKNSAHMSGEAVDISDPEGVIWNWLIENLDYCIRLGIYLEDKSRTPRHVHVQMRVPPSGNRVFLTL